MALWSTNDEARCGHKDFAKVDMAWAHIWMNHEAKYLFDHTCGPVECGMMDPIQDLPILLKTGPDQNMVEVLAKKTYNLGLNWA